MQHKLATLNTQLERFMPLITPSGVLAGLLLPALFLPFKPLVPWLFAVMTFSGSLSLKPSEFRQVIAAPLPPVLFLVFAHIAMPLAAFGAASLFAAGQPAAIAGCTLVFAIPTGVVSFMWVSIHRGNAALSLSLILLDTLLAPLLVPATSSILLGTSLVIDSWGMMLSLLGMIVLPSIAGIAVNRFSRIHVGSVLRTWTAPVSKIGIFFVVAANAAIIATSVPAIDARTAWLALLCLALAAVGFLGARGMAAVMRWDRATTVSFTFNGGMRNISAGAVIAITFFPPEASIPVIFAMVFQQSLSAFFGRWFFGTDRQKNKKPQDE